MNAEQLRVRDIRTMPFFWVQRALLDHIKPSWQGLLAYNALAYYAADSKCKNVSVLQLAEKIGCSEDTMRRGLKDLVGKKAIRMKFHHRKTKTGKRQQVSNEYTLVGLEIETKL